MAGEVSLAGSSWERASKNCKCGKGEAKVRYTCQLSSGVHHAGEDLRPSPACSRLLRNGVPCPRRCSPAGKKSEMDLTERAVFEQRLEAETNPERTKMLYGFPVSSFSSLLHRRSRVQTHLPIISSQKCINSFTFSLLSPSASSSTAHVSRRDPATELRPDEVPRRSLP